METYKMKGVMHFGTIRQTVNENSEIKVDRKNGLTIINGVEFKGTKDIDIAVKINYIVSDEPIKKNIKKELPIRQTKRVAKKESLSDKKKKMNVIRTEDNETERVIPIKKIEKKTTKVQKKAKELKIIRDKESTEDVRGLNVIRAEKVETINQTSDVPKSIAPETMVNATDIKIEKVIETKPVHKKVERNRKKQSKKNKGKK